MPDFAIFNDYEFDKLIKRERGPLSEYALTDRPPKPIDIWKPLVVPECGTEAGDSAHRRRLEECEECREAHLVKQRERRAAKVADMDEWGR